jgi:hypothetical protein
MRIFLCTKVLILAIMTSASAQTTIGLQVQGGEAWQYYGEEIAINGFDQRIPHYGWSVEVFHPLGEHFALGVAPGYSRRGAACFPGFAGNRVPSVADAALYANYLELPFLLKSSFPIAGRLKGVVQLGAGFSYLLDGHWKLSFSLIDTEPEKRPINFEDDDFLNRFDFAARGGLGFSYPLGPGALQLLGNYYHGFLDVNDNNTSLNRSWSVGLSYHYQLGKF